MPDIKEIIKKVQHLYDRIPEGEYRTEVGWILHELQGAGDTKVLDLKGDNITLSKRAKKKGED